MWLTFLVGGPVALRLPTPLVPTPALDRRAMLLGACTLLTALPQTPAVAKESKLSATELDDIIERAKRGDLTTDKVFMRALQNNLIDPIDVKDCRALENIRYIDMQALTELSPAVRQIGKLADAAKRADDVRLAEQLKEAQVSTSVVLSRLNDQMARIQMETLSRSCDGRVL